MINKVVLMFYRLCSDLFFPQIWTSNVKVSRGVNIPTRYTDLPCIETLQEDRGAIPVERAKRHLKGGDMETS